METGPLKMQELCESVLLFLAVELFEGGLAAETDLAAAVDVDDLHAHDVALDRKSVV